MGCIECYSNSWGYLPHNSMTDPSPFSINYSNRICSNSRLNHMWHHQLTMSSREWSVCVCNIFQDTDKWTRLTLKFKMFPPLFVTFLALSKYHWLMMWQCSHFWLLILRPWYLYLCTVLYMYISTWYCNRNTNIKVVFLQIINNVFNLIPRHSVHIKNILRLHIW